jgi:hypothetical protein
MSFLQQICFPEFQTLYKVSFGLVDTKLKLSIPLLLNRRCVPEQNGLR